MRRVELFGYAGILLLTAAALLRLVVVDSGAPALGLLVAGVVSLLVYFFRAEHSVQIFLGRRSTREGSNALGTALFVTGIVILINILTIRFHARVDVTEDRLFTLSPETVAALRDAPAPPEVWVFYPETSAVTEIMREILESARFADPRFTYHIIDPGRDPLKAMEFQLKTYGSVVQVGERFETFTGVNEEAFLTALIKASRSDTPFLGFLRGHGEASSIAAEPRDLRSATEMLLARGYSPFNLNILTGAHLSDSLDVVIAIGPQTELGAEEIDSLRTFLDRGGALLLALDPSSPVTFGRILEPMGLSYDPRFLSDPDQIDPQVIHPEEYANHPVVFSLGERRIQVSMPGAGEFLQIGTPPGVRQSALMRSGDRTVISGDPEAVPRSRVTAVAVERDLPGGGRGRIVAFADADFVSNRYFGTLGNGDLFLAAVQWLAERDDLIAIRPRPQTNRPVLITRQQGRALMVLVVGLLPLVVLLAGVRVWWRRR